jgi:UDP:flavonoid glycosyltransferase YjiC (YdhE family)
MGAGMRILFTSRPAFGHLHPLIPLARAAAAAGHAVAFATGAPFRDAIERQGFTAFEAGLNVARWRRQLAALGADRIDRSAHRPFFFGEVFSGIEVPPRLADLRIVLARWQPEILVHGVAEFAGPLAASLAGIPYVTCGYGPLLQPEIAELAGIAAARHWQAAGLDPDAGRMYRSLYLDPCPPSLQIPAAAALPARRLIRPAEREDADDFAGSHWPASLHARPTVYLTLGTIFNRDLDVVRAVLQGLAHAPVNVIATVGPDLEPGRVGAQPANAHICRYIPQAQVLERCDLVICHGGAGSILGALGFGLPLLLLPRGADNFYNADRVVAAGAGRQLLPAEITPRAIAREAAFLLDDARVHAAARHIAAEITTLPAPSSVLGALPDLLATHPPSRPARLDPGPPAPRPDKPSAGPESAPRQPEPITGRAPIAH